MKMWKASLQNLATTVHISHFCFNQRIFYQKTTWLSYPIYPTFIYFSNWKAAILTQLTWLRQNLGISQNMTSGKHFKNGRSAGNGAYTQNGTTFRVMMVSIPKVSFHQRAAPVLKIMDDSLCHCNMNWLSLYPFLIMLRVGLLELQSSESLTFPNLGWDFNLSLSWCWVFHSILWHFPLFVMDPRFRSRRYNILYETNSKDSYKYQIVMAVLLYKLFGTYLAHTLWKCSLQWMIS
jgi:hypothetical protein